MSVSKAEGGELISFMGMSPRLHPSVFVASGAKIIGDATIGEDSSIWFNAVVRADVHYIRIGSKTNVQDLCVLHVTNKKHPLVIGDGVTVGHSATLHGAEIKDNCLIGTAATVLDGAVVNSFSIVAAGALVREGFVAPPGTLVAGVPAKVIRELKEEEYETIARLAENYVKYVVEYRAKNSR